MTRHDDNARRRRYERAFLYFTCFRHAAPTGCRRRPAAAKQRGDEPMTVIDAAFDITALADTLSLPPRAQNASRRTPLRALRRTSAKVDERRLFSPKRVLPSL